MKKVFWRSKTLWFNAVIAALAALESSAHLVQSVVPGNVYAWGLLVLVAGNAVLRVITKQGVSLK